MKVEDWRMSFSLDFLFSTRIGKKSSREFCDGVIKQKKKTSELTSIQELNNLSKYSAAVCLFCAGIKFN